MVCGVNGYSAEKLAELSDYLDGKVLLSCLLNLEKKQRKQLREYEKVLRENNNRKAHSMGKKDRGWDYLNSSGDNFDYDKENDGSWGYENDDGSGSFYGADGSWGYKNSDGSASYYGADGSWGYKNADGSGSYYGNDGSWGYKNSDGSGSYYGSDNDSEYYDSDDDEDSDYSSNDGDVSGGAAVVGALIGLGLAAFVAGRSKNNQSDYDDDGDDDEYDDEYIIRQQKFEEKRREEAKRQAELEQVKKDKRKARFKRVWSAIAHKKMIDVNIKSEECIGQNYLKVIALFEKNGFSKIQTNIVEDLEYCDIDRENYVTDVIVAGNTYFDMTTQAKYDSDVVIIFHKLKRVAIPISYKEAKKISGKDVVTAFVNAGFVNVTENVIRDLTFGWLKKDGAVDSVIVSGEGRYRKDMAYRIDTPVVVTYHAFKSK